MSLSKDSPIPVSIRLTKSVESSSPMIIIIGTSLNTQYSNLKKTFTTKDKKHPQYGGFLVPLYPVG